MSEVTRSIFTSLGSDASPFRISLKHQNNNWFCISTLRDWLKNAAPLCHPIGSKTPSPIVTLDALVLVENPFFLKHHSAVYNR